MRIYTLGYQGLSFQSYIEKLVAAGIDLVVDVRETAWSHKPGFCKGPLIRGLNLAGINYVHLKAAGNPKQNRRTSRSATECLRRYKRYLFKNPRCLDQVLDVLNDAHAQDKTVCLTCFERSAAECHRSILVAALVERSGAIIPVHIES
jgi:uncharacterized protein (DUF488 family)